MRAKVIIVLLLMWVSPDTRADLAVAPELRVSARYHYHHKIDERLAELTLRPSVEVLGPNSLARFSGRLRWLSNELLDVKPPSSRTYDSASDISVLGRNASAEIREAYLSWWSQDWQVTLGRQLLDWGKMDGYKILDAVNPQDFREYILEDFDQSRIGTWGIRVEQNLPNIGWQVYWSPDRSTHDLADPGTAFELAAPRFQPIGGMPQTAIERTSPDRDLVAFELSRTSDKLEWRIVFVDGFEYEPLILSNSGALVQTYPRRRLAGGNFEYAAGPFLIRAEAAYRFERLLARRVGPGITAAVDQVTMGLGIDYAAPWSVNMSFQLIRDQVIDAPIGLVRPTKDNLATLNIRRGFLNDTVRADVRLYHAFDNNDGLFRATFNYVTARRGAFRLGIDQFHGSADGFFGQFDAQDRVFLEWSQVY